MLVINILIKPLWILGIQITVQNRVGVEDFGMYFTLLNFGFLFFIITDPGLNNYTNRETSASPAFLKSRFLTIAVFKVLLAVLFAAMLLVSGKYFMNYSDRFMNLLVPITLNLVLSSFLLFLRSAIAGLQLFVWDSIAGVLDRMFMIVLCGVFLFHPVLNESFTIDVFIYLQTIAYAFAILYGTVVLVLKKIPLIFRFKMSLLGEVIQQTYPYALLALFMSFYTRIDSVMIERLAVDGTGDAGIYAQGFKLYEAGNMVAVLFAGLLLPVFSNMLQKRENVGEIADWSLRLLVIPSVFIALFCSMYGGYVIDFLFVHEIEQTARLFPVLMWAFVAVALNYIYGTLLTAGGKLKFLNILALSGAAGNLFLNYLLIPRYGALGAAWATLLTQGLVAVGQTAKSFTLYKLVFQRGSLLWVTLLIAGNLLVFWLVSYFEFSNDLIAVVMIPLTFASLFYFKIIDFKSIFKLLKTR